MMRRKEREIKQLEEIINIMQSCEVMRLALCDGIQPYIIPLNYGYLVNENEIRIYFHSAKQGRKIEIIKEHPYCCFEMDCSLAIGRGEVACEWTANYESVVGEGQISLVQKSDKKEEAMNAIMSHYGFEGTPVYQKNILDHTALYEIKVENISGKRNLG